jgi:WbqC-like protein family/Acetyltransferase (GNAT) family
MLAWREVVDSLVPLNGTHFQIPDLEEYARKTERLGKSIETRLEGTNELVSYILYYDDREDLFVSMVWTHPQHQGKGYATRLLTRLAHSTHKDIRLEVHKDNPATRLYEAMGFSIASRAGDVVTLVLQKRMAIMQPYLFPYIGYFHLIAASHRYVFYDDVNFITRGWINRNRILVDGKDYLFTVPVSKASQNRLIMETPIAIDKAWKDKFARTIAQAYRRAPYFEAVAPLVTEVFAPDHASIGDLAINSITSVCQYLGIEFNWTRSSVCSPHTKGIDRADRLIEIVKSEGYHRYVNAPGGMELYTKEYFKAHDVELGFVESKPVEYTQFSNTFVPALSIIDVLMFNDPSTIRALFKKYAIA